MKISNFLQFKIEGEKLKSIRGGDASACQNLSNCMGSRHGACIHSNNYGDCMDIQEMTCYQHFGAACLAP
jgi:hypothetical protein